MAKKKKHVLVIEQSFDFDMIGICSHHNDYRLAWGINDKMNLCLTKSAEDYIITNRKGEILSIHSMYEYIDEENRLEYYLVRNKNSGKYLIPEKSGIDFFLFLNNNLVFEVDEVIGKLRSVTSVLGVYSFDPEELPSAETLVFS